MMAANVAFTPTPNDLALELLVGEISKQDPDRVLCIEIDSKDPAEASMAKLRSKEHKVVGGSDCQRSMKGSIEKSSGRPAMFLSVENFQPTSPDRATINFNRYVAGLWAIFETISVKRDADKRTVVAILKHSEA